MSTIITAQEIIGRSGLNHFNMSKELRSRPLLEIDKESIKIADSDRNSVIDANETITLYFTISNSGQGNAYDLTLSIKEITGATGLSYDVESNVDDLPGGHKRNVKATVISDMNTSNSKALFQILVKERNGYDSEPVFIEVDTQAFSEPNLSLADFSVKIKDGTTLRRNSPFEFSILIQNNGKGTANDVIVNLSYSDFIWCKSANEIQSIGMIRGGESRVLKYELATAQFTSSEAIELNFDIKEKYNKYGQSKTITLMFDNEYNFKDLEQKSQFVELSSNDSQKVPSVSDVDINIPSINNYYPYRYALVIGNENYSEYQKTLKSESNVSYARNDASVFAQYAQFTLGIEEKNIFLVFNATAGVMVREINKVMEMVTRVGNQAELFIYYAGHGFPDENTRIPYLMPVDVSSSDLSSAIRLNDFYRKAAATGADRVIIFLDACFSGGGRENGLLTARSVKVKPKEDIIEGNVLVFSASSGEQSSLPYHSEKHGFFTYFLLKKLQQTHGNITFGELSNFLSKTVGIESLRINEKAQDPVTSMSYQIEHLWEDWLINP